MALLQSPLKPIGVCVRLFGGKEDAEHVPIERHAPNGSYAK
jgi:hypothetical protein